MRQLENLLGLEQFISLVSESHKDSHSSLWWNDCVSKVQNWISTDLTTTKENLHEKAKNYALNYLSTIPDISSGQKSDLAGEIADEVENTRNNSSFNQKPLANIVAQKERNKIPEDPERRFIKMGK